MSNRLFYGVSMAVAFTIAIENVRVMWHQFEPASFVVALVASAAFGFSTYGFLTQRRPGICKHAPEHRRIVIRAIREGQASHEDAVITCLGCSHFWPIGQEPRP